MFNQDVFDRKVEELIAMSKSIEYVPAELKRDDDWTAAPKGLRRKDGKFFKVLMVLAKAAGGSSWIQPSWSKKATSTTVTSASRWLVISFCPSG